MGRALEKEKREGKFVIAVHILVLFPFFKRFLLHI